MFLAVCAACEQEMHKENLLNLNETTGENMSDAVNSAERAGGEPEVSCRSARKPDYPDYKRILDFGAYYLSIFSCEMLFFRIITSAIM